MKAAVLTAIALAIPLSAQVKIITGSGQYSVTVNGKPFTDFYFGPETMKPYLHPLRTQSGVVVTRGYPMLDNVAGESKDHPHHRGLWFTHGDVNGYDFWANEPSQKSPRKGKIVVEKISAKSGAQTGVINGTFAWLDPDGKPLLRELRVMAFHSNPTNRIVDFDIGLFALDRKVVFGDTKEGTFAIRLAAGLEEKMPKSLPNPPRTGKMVSSTGDEGEKMVWGKQFPWVDYSGLIDGEAVGVAIFDHPDNPKHPTYWHSRSYGLFAANIFGEHDFYNDKSRNGSVTVEPGSSLRFRYRVVVHPGNTRAAGLAELYKQYTGR